MVLLVCALAWPALAPGQIRDPIDVKAYRPTTLEKLFAAAPKSRDATVELLPADDLARIEAQWTGNRRTSPEIAPLVI